MPVLILGISSPCLIFLSLLLKVVLLRTCRCISRSSAMDHKLWGAWGYRSSLWLLDLFPLRRLSASLFLSTYGARH
ncbi:hypothetical protein HDV57DRAFT_145248 [Trichoderma longibrachiatum]